MAHITEIRIDGLLGRPERIDIKLDRHANIFFGENGCGKTTLLKVLHAALSLDSVSMANLPVSKAEVSIYSITNGKSIKHVWEKPSSSEVNALSRLASIEQLTLQESLLDHSSASANDFLRAVRKLDAKVQWKMIPSPKTPTNSWNHTFLPTTRLYFGQRMVAGGAKSELSESELDRLFTESVTRAWLQFYSETLSKVRRIQEDGIRSILREVLSPPHNNDGPKKEMDPEVAYQKANRFLSRESGVDAIGTFKEFEGRYISSPDLQRVVGNIDSIEALIERAMAPVEKFLGTITALLSRGKQLTLVNNQLEILLSSGDRLDLSSLSSGEKHLVKILLSVITAGPNTVIIDEPELSMHIDWQRLFVSTALAVNPECQLILASHSPEVMADINDNCIFKL